jgi:hypothetical protein
MAPFRSSESRKGRRVTIAPTRGVEAPGARRNGAASSGSCGCAPSSHHATLPGVRAKLARDQGVQRIVPSTPAHVPRSYRRRHAVRATYPLAVRTLPTAGRSPPGGAGRHQPRRTGGRIVAVGCGGGGLIASQAALKIPLCPSGGQEPRAATRNRFAQRASRIDRLREPAPVPRFADMPRPASAEPHPHRIRRRGRRRRGSRSSSHQRRAVMWLLAAMLIGGGTAYLVILKQ